ncbi:MAG: MAPEG family protein, partial [Parvularculaceae bacterium]|nr:MAPEG family protein [Parvularculaceae bacterium]
GRRRLLAASEAKDFGADAEESAYRRLRYAVGAPEIGDFAPETLFAADANFDALSGVDYRKGCFVGQEVTSRMKRKGEIRKRTLLVARAGGPAAGPRRRGRRRRSRTRAHSFRRRRSRPRAHSSGPARGGRLASGPRRWRPGRARHSVLPRRGLRRRDRGRVRHMLSSSAVALLGFVAWTVVLLMLLGLTRTGISLRGKPANSFKPSGEDTPGFPQRLSRAHANCYENLPAAGAILLYAIATDQTAVTDSFALVFLGARVAQSVTHLLSTANPMVLVRFVFFLVQQIILVTWLLAFLRPLIA